MSSPVQSSPVQSSPVQSSPVQSSPVQSVFSLSCPYLLFRLHESLYAVRAVQVREIIWLPGLTPIEESPPYITGVFNLRGKIVPVIDLDVRFGHQRHRYQISNSVVVMEMENRLMGIIVSEVLDVLDIAAADIEVPPDFREGKSRPHFFDGEAKAGDDIIMLLNADNLIKHLEPLEVKAGDDAEAVLAEHPLFCPDATPREKAVFRERAHNLRQSGEDAGLSGQMPVAVVGIGGEYFGLDVGLVREFTDVRRVTPVPCCPAHIVGNMNLRGNIVTLVDIRNLLNLPSGGPNALKAVVAEMGETLVGIAVNEVFDIAYLRQSDMIAVPSAATSAEKYVKGTAPYGGRMMTVLDLRKIFAEGELVVNEEG